MPRHEDLRDLLPFATEAQARAIHDVLETGSFRAAARKQGVNHDNVRRVIGRLRKRAARLGHAPECDLTKVVPEGFHLKGASTLYDADGTVRLQWVKSQVDQEAQLDRLFEAAEKACDSIRVAKKLAPPSTATDSEIMALYPWGDPHLGLYASAANAGKDWNLAKGIDCLLDSVQEMVSLVPAARVGVLANLGDYFHTDTDLNMTRRSGHILDVDGFWGDILQAGIEVQITAIRLMLQKHQTVHVKNVIGNHDDASSKMLSLVIAHHFKDNPRVIVDQSFDRFLWLEFGQNFIGFTHGDKGGPKPSELGPVMACDKPQEWARCKHRFWYTGHVHHDTLKEYPGVTVETFRTLASSDAYHHQKGYRSGRDLKCDILHKTRGRVLRFTEAPELD